MRLASLLVVVVACTPSSKQAPAPATQPVTSAGGDTSRSLVYASGEATFEGPAFKNACAADADCKVGGCSSEICTAEEGVNSACVVHADQARDATCGCVKGDCVWYRAASTAPVEAQGGGGAAQGMPCADGKCAAGLECVAYYGIAGPRGPQFTSCEIRCGMAGKGCPEGQKCITIADGPGQVCRPPQ